jgi:predicted dehydrogenase/type 1 glutamine amidotransferase
VTARVGIGLVGLGGISRAHRAGYARIGDRARLVAVCDTDGDLAARVGAEVGARVYTDFDDLLTDDAVTAVDVTLPHHLHFGAASRALQSGRHVLIEKPLAMTAHECRALIDLAETGERTVAVAENTRFVGAYLAVADLVRSGALGDIRLARTLISGSEVARLRDTSLWKGKQAGSGGGTIIDAGPHSFYLLRWLLGEFATVRAFSSKLVAESEVEDHAVVGGRMQSGALYTSEFTFTAEIPWGERLELYGSEGSIIVDQLQNPPVIHYHGKADAHGEPVAGVAHDPLGWKADSIAAGVADFVNAIAEGREPTVTASDGLHGVEIAEHAYASIRAGGAELPVGRKGHGGGGGRDLLLHVTDVAPYAAAGPDGLPVLGGVHGVLPQAALAMAEVAASCGLAFAHATSVTDIPVGQLERARVLVLFTIGETAWSAEQRAVIASRVELGELHLLGLHSAADSCAGWPEFGELLGARFDGHPWTCTFTINVRDGDHPATRAMPTPWRFKDELYLFRDLRPDARILLEAPGDDLDMDVPGARRPPHGYPISWCFEHGKGRVFYTALGHFPSAYEDVRFLGHLRGGLRWLLGKG